MSELPHTPEKQTNLVQAPTAFLTLFKKTIGFSWIFLAPILFFKGVLLIPLMAFYLYFIWKYGFQNFLGKAGKFGLRFLLPIEILILFIKCIFSGNWMQLGVTLTLHITGMLMLFGIAGVIRLYQELRFNKQNKRLTKEGAPTR